MKCHVLLLKSIKGFSVNPNKDLFYILQFKRSVNNAAKGFSSSLHINPHVLFRLSFVCLDFL